MSQTTITYPLPIGIAGQLADLYDGNDVIPAVNAESTANMGFGLMLMKGTGDSDALLYTGTAVGIGVLVHSHIYDNGPNGELDTISTVPGLRPKTILNVLRRGRIYVLVEENVSAYDRAYVRKSSGAGGTILGSFRKSADTATAVDFTKTCQFLTSASAGGIALLEVNMLLS